MKTKAVKSKEEKANERAQDAALEALVRRAIRLVQRAIRDLNEIP